ncbi:integral membrane sensor signal transduction histidine kinase [Chthoniobacter flavus Ellin428]|uniref:histidine kinase n=1 Tax=Chthoniobacter flavus Ellin428 TaxID=497964 RepID=B4DAE0_9BACT|nr:sensor histidine kinase [Chthoniobacter flavus]EDY16601.1 integral membrane sensor signal transduction histidine kinase [Chthoniobacter flavus Ellin428]TCO91978.1 signal transduction histidine kinase [Chthoniobacter flavus]
MKPQPRASSSVATAAIAMVTVAIIGWIDYLTGEYSLAVFYLGPICFAAWRAGRSVGHFIALFSVAAWVLSDFGMGRVYGHPLMPYWNAAILAAIYGIVVHLLCALHALQMELEARVAQRTSALANANVELKAMEREVMEITERERQRIGEDLHDSLGQKLTAASLTANALVLESTTAELTSLAEGLGRQLREAIAETRTLSHGLAPVSLQDDGLMHALHALADSTTQAVGVRCVFDCPAPVPVTNSTIAFQFYRIAQEAVNNAVKHATASEIRIGLERHGETITVEVEDDGTGLPEPVPASKGIGLRVMRHRTQLISGTLEIGSSPAGGTRVSCRAQSPL